MRGAALATGLLLLALAGHLDRDFIKDALLPGPGPFEALVLERFDRPGVALKLKTEIESHTAGARSAALEKSIDQQISQ